MEHLTFACPSSPAAFLPRAATLAGVVGSGNLEVLLGTGERADQATFTIATSAQGFADTWQAVLAQWCEEHAAGRLAFAIHDAGATPAVVTLRLTQVLGEALAAASGEPG